MKFPFVKGEEDLILIVFIQDSSVSTGAGLGSLDEGSSITGGYVKRNGTGVALAVDENVAVEGTYAAPSSAAQVRIGTVANMPAGTYELHFHNDLFTTADYVTIILSGAVDMVPLRIEIQMTSINPNDAVRGGMTALPNAAAEASGGLYTRGAGAGQIKQDDNGTIDVDVQRIFGSILSEGGAGRLAAAFVKLFDVVTPLLVASDVMVGTDGANTTTPPTVNEVRDGILDDATRFSGGNIDAAISSRGTADAGDAMALTAAAVDAIWDEELTAATHNVATSAGRRLRDIASNIVLTGTSPDTAGTANTAIRIELDDDASSDDGAYDPAIVVITGGLGMGQSRQIFEYDGDNKFAYINRSWKVIPDDTSAYTIVGSSGDTHVNEGLVTGGGDDTITLNTLASDQDDVYLGQSVFLFAGTGEDQERTIIAYNGTTKVATVDRDWIVNPVNGETVYAVLPNADITRAMVAIAAAQTDLDTLTAARGEPGQGALPESATTNLKMDYLYKFMRNVGKVNKTTLLEEVYANDGVTVDHQAPVSDNGTIFTKGKFVSG